VVRGFGNVEMWMGRLMARERVKRVLGKRRGESSKPLPEWLMSGLDIVRVVNG
jgi:hypothetical protein